MKKITTELVLQIDNLTAGEKDKKETLTFSAVRINGEFNRLPRLQINGAVYEFDELSWAHLKGFTSAV